MTPDEDATTLLDKTEHKQKCPLCGLPATFKFLLIGTRKKFYCDKCKCFIIDPDTEEVLSKEQKEEFSNKSSRCHNQTILHIRFAKGTRNIIAECESENNWK